LSQNETGGINSGRSRGAKRLRAARAARGYLKLLRCVFSGGAEAMSRGMKRVCRVGVVASLLIVAVPGRGWDGAWAQGEPAIRTGVKATEPPQMDLMRK